MAYYNALEHMQSLVYCCIGMDERLRLGEIRKGYECAEECPGGMCETTYWMQTDGLPVLVQAAEDKGACTGGTNWLYNVCEMFGHMVMDHALKTGKWASDQQVAQIAKDVIAEYGELYEGDNQ